METQQLNKISIEQLLSPFASFPDDAKVWIYQSNRILTNQDVEIISKGLETFFPEWNAHKKAVMGSGAVIKNAFLVLVADERTTQLSGCAMDQAVAMVKALNEQLNVDFFNRFQVALDMNGELKLSTWEAFRSQREQGQIDPAQRVFNHMHTGLGSMRKRWIIPVSESWHWRV